MATVEEVRACIEEGMTYRQIGARLGCSHAMVGKLAARIDGNPARRVETDWRPQFLADANNVTLFGPESMARRWMLRLEPSVKARTSIGGGAPALMLSAWKHWRKMASHGVTNDAILAGVPVARRTLVARAVFDERLVPLLDMRGTVST